MPRRPASRYLSQKNHHTKARLRPTMEVLEDRLTPSGVIPPGLVSWWTADNTAADLLGRTNAALVGGATYAAGKVGQAFSFDGVDDRVQVADSASLKLTKSLSIGVDQGQRSLTDHQRGDPLSRRRSRRPRPL